MYMYPSPPLSAVVHIPAQEVPTSPQRDLPTEDLTTLTFHGRTPLKAPSMVKKYNFVHCLIDVIDVHGKCARVC